MDPEQIYEALKFSVIAFIIGGIFAFTGLAFLSWTIRFVRRSARTTATVVGHLRNEAQKDFPVNLLRPIVEFTDGEDKTCRVAIKDGEVVGYVVGARIAVRYDPEKPDEVHRSSLVGLWFVSLFCTGAGFLFVVAGVLGWVFRASANHGSTPLRASDNPAETCPIFIGVGVLAAAIGLAFLSWTIRFVRRSARTTATVVGHLRNEAQKDFPQKFLESIVALTDGEGKAYRLAMSERGALGADVGTRFAVRYERENPGKLHRSGLGLWLLPASITVIGCLLAAGGVLLWVFWSSILPR